MTTSRSGLGEDLEWTKKAQTATRLINESIERLSERNPSHAYEARKWKGVIEEEFDRMVMNLQNMERLGREKLDQYDAKLRLLGEREVRQWERDAQSTAKEQAAISATNQANEAEKLDQRKSDLNTFKRELETRESTLTEAVTMLELQSQGLRQQKEEFEKERQLFRDQEAEYRGQALMVIEYKRLKDQEIEAIKSKVPRLEQDNKRLLEEEKCLKTANEDLLSKIRELENIVNVLNTESMDRADNISILRGRLAKLEDASEKAQQTCEEEHTGITYLRQQLDSVKSDRDEILARGKRLQELSNEKAKSLETGYSKELEAGQRDRDHLPGCLALCQEQLDNYMEEHAVLVEENHTLKEKYQTDQAHYRDRRREFHTSLDNSNEEIDRLMSKLIQAEAACDTLDMKLDVAQDRVHELEESMTEVQGEHALVSQKLQTSNES